MPLAALALALGGSLLAAMPWIPWERGLETTYDEPTPASYSAVFAVWHERDALGWWWLGVAAATLAVAALAARGRLPRAAAVAVALLAGAGALVAAVTGFDGQLSADAGPYVLLLALGLVAVAAGAVARGRPGRAVEPGARAAVGVTAATGIVAGLCAPWMVFAGSGAPGWALLWDYDVALAVLAVLLAVGAATRTAPVALPLLALAVIGYATATHEFIELALGPGPVVAGAAAVAAAVALATDHAARDLRRNLVVAGAGVVALSALAAWARPSVDGFDLAGIGAETGWGRSTALSAGLLVTGAAVAAIAYLPTRRLRAGAAAALLAAAAVALVVALAGDSATTFQGEPAVREVAEGPWIALAGCVVALAGLALRPRGRSARAG